MAGKRIQTYFGVPIPPWRDRKLGAGAVTIRFVIKGPIPSKKNNQQAVTRRKEAAAFLNDLFAKQPMIDKAQAFAAIKLVSAKMRGNDRYRDFVTNQRPIMEAQRDHWLSRLGPRGLTFPISAAAVNIRFYFAQKYRQDSANKQQSVQDLLKDCLIIFDDDYTTINPITTDADCYHQEITENLVVVSISFRLP